MPRIRKTLRMSAVIVAAVLWLWPSVGLAEPSQKLPNLVIILADDLGYGDIGAYGSEVHETPEIDQLMEDGVRFDSFYVTSSVCTPTRVALLTGRHPVRVGFSTLLWPTTEGGLPATENTLGELLQREGYTTGLSGKWHLGHSAPEHLPLAHGFDCFYGMPYPNDMGPGHPVEPYFGGPWPPMPMMLGNEVIETGVDVNLLTQQYTADAMRFIAAHHNEPFFLFLSHAMPHSIVGASPEFRGRSQNGLYGDAVQELDWSLGQIRRTLRTFGLEENTLIILSSDNGAVLRESYDKRPEYLTKMFPDGTMGSNGILRGGKQSTFEGGIRVPTVFAWPGSIPSGQIVSEPAWIADVLPTFLDVIGVDPPNDRTYDGVSLRRLLQDGATRGVEPEFAFGRNGLTALRLGDWKLVTRDQPAFTPLSAEGPMLFNLGEDPGESKNLAHENPKILSKLQNRLESIGREFERDQTSR